MPHITTLDRKMFIRLATECYFICLNADVIHPKLEVFPMWIISNEQYIGSKNVQKENHGPDIAMQMASWIKKLQCILCMPKHYKTNTKHITFINATANVPTIHIDLATSNQGALFQYKEIIKLWKLFITLAQEQCDQKIIAKCL